MEATTKTLNVTLHVRELVHDIRNRAYLSGRSLESSGQAPYRYVSDMQMPEDPSSEYQVMRSLEQALSMLRASLSEYLKTDACEDSDNLVSEEIDGRGEIRLVLELPSNFDDACTGKITEGMHSYLVYSALAQWSQLLRSEDFQTYSGLATAGLDAVLEALSSRSRPKRQN